MKNKVRNSMLLFSTVGFAAASMLLVSISNSVMAQDDVPEYINIRIVTVKANKNTQFEGLIKERGELEQAANQPFRHVFQRLRGPLNTYLIVTTAGNIGEPPVVPLSATWLTAINDTVASASLNTLQTYPEAFTLEDVSAPPTDYLHVRARTVATGRNQDYLEWLRDDLIPAAQKANAGDIRTARVVLGGSNHMWVTFSFVDGWPPNENLLAQSMGERDFQRMIEKAESMQTSGFDYFYQFRSDLSYTSD